MALTITESWIRERVKLKHDHLDDVKSLSLPGTYHEKIFLLGNSLRGFSRLKHLDLSRNSLASTEGLEFLSNLESLNLYYNNISTINDLHHLRHLTNLKDLDLRLNPVTKNEPDYRLFLVHLLPNLRRLDDRSVRDSERRAAVMHFTTDQAAELDADYPPQNPRSYEPEPVRIGIPRAEMVRGLSSRPHVELDDEDVAVLDLVSRTGGDISKNRRITGSAATRPNTDDFTRDELSHMRTTPIKRFESRNTPGIRPHPTARQDKDRVYVKFSPDTQLQNNSDPNLKYTDETDAYDVVRTRGHFTTNPTLPVQPESLTSDHMIAPDVARDQVIRRSQESHPSKGRHSERVPPERPLENGEVHASQVRTDKNPVRSFGLSPPRPVQNGFTDGGANLVENNDGDRQNKDAHGKTQIAESSPQEMETLSKLLDLVDKYWNGSRSLHRNIKFRGMARDILSSSYYQRSANAPDSTLGNRDEEFRAKVAVHSADVSRLRDQVAEQHRELESLREKLREKEGLQTSLQLTNQEQTALKLRMKDIQEENQTLRSKLASLEASNMSVSEQHKCIGDLQKQNSILQEQTKSLNQQVEQQNCNLKQLQDLTNMLQESHRSLVSTNDHLLKELDETRQRHHHEVHQLHWSYDQLKKTVDWLPTSTSTK